MLRSEQLLPNFPEKKLEVEHRKINVWRTYIDVRACEDSHWIGKVIGQVGNGPVGSLTNRHAECSSVIQEAQLPQRDSASATHVFQCSCTSLNTAPVVQRYKMATHLKDIW